MNGKNIREVLLEVLNEHATDRNLQSGTIVQKTSRRLELSTKLEDQQAILTAWHDLFRAGTVAWGCSLTSAGPPFLHLTEKGREVLRHITRDPSNPDGYMEYLSQNASLDPVVTSYVREALETYNNQCFKAAAVMIGVAAESLARELGEKISSCVSSRDEKPSKKLSNWKAKVLLDGIAKELDKYKAAMSKPLREAVESYWPAFIHQIRTVRNDAGHPVSLEAISEATVHANLLIFPELVKLVSDIIAWLEESDARRSEK